MNIKEAIDVLERNCDFHYDETDKCYGCLFENSGWCYDDFHESLLSMLKEHEARILDWDNGCYEKVTHSNEVARNIHEAQHLCNVAREKNEESKRIPQDVLEKAIEFIYGLIKEKETNCIEQYEPDEKGWRFGAKKKLFDDGNNTGK